MHRTALALCGDFHLAQDLVQQALVKVYLAWPLRDPAAAPAYLHKAGVRAWIDQGRRSWWRHERATEPFPELAAEVLAEDPTGTPLLDALARLPRQQRAAVVLRHLEGYSVEETASLLNISTGSVKTHTSRGLRALREELTEDMELRSTW
ncbi:SigE family RNA polymerase sigma factor [Motilibacter aurantiacus]|uniref:SigE family RNA polymerase sigma factor n=1 Tax=Motilibacter aurantiacus TaxID=2714955 RepID=UPI001E3A08AE|nr:SigE family RNA polymerase sigma factor [Motilibacter aurantiacus]